MLTYERLTEVLDYDPEAGEFTWRVMLSSRGPEGTRAGCLRGSEYVFIGIDGKQYKRSRLAWLWMTGEWPVGTIDHRNRVKWDDRILNLRDVTTRRNLFNRPLPPSNHRRLPTRVYLENGQYAAYIKDLGIVRRLGGWSTPAEAHEAYLAERRRLEEQS